MVTNFENMMVSPLDDRFRCLAAVGYEAPRAMTSDARISLFVTQQLATSQV